MSDNFVRTTRAVTILTMSLFTIALWISRASFARWIADDYCFAAASIHDGFWQSQQAVYEHASGRFTVALLYAVLTRLGRGAAPAIAIMAMALWIAFAHLAASRALRAARGIEIAAAASGFIATVLVTAPDIYQPLIWLGGLLTYGLPVIAATWLVAELVRDSARLPLVAAVAFFAGGCSEVAAVAQIAFAGTACVAWQSRRRALLTIVFASLAALAIVAAAPGNFERRALFHSAPLSQALKMAIEQTLPMLWAIAMRGSLFLLPLTAFLALIPRDSTLRTRATWPAVLALLATIAGTLCGALYGTGRLPWGRVQFVPVAYTVFTIVVIAWTITPRATRAVENAATGLMIAAVIVCALSTPLDALRESRAFAAAADRVERAAASARPGNDVFVKAAPREFEYLEYVSGSPDHWTNRCIARYFSLGSIRSDGLRR